MSNRQSQEPLQPPKLQPPSNPWDEVTKDTETKDFYLKIAVGIGAGGLAEFGAFVAAADRFAGVFRSGVALFSLTPGALLAITLVASNGVVAAFVFFAQRYFYRWKERRWLSAWTPPMSLSPSLSLRARWVRDRNNNPTGVVSFTLCLFNRSSRKWHIRHLDWSTSSTTIDDTPQPVPAYYDLAATGLAPWATWQQEYRFTASIAVAEVPVRMLVKNVMVHVESDSANEKGTSSFQIPDQETIVWP